MSKLATIEVGPRKFDIHAATGEVMDARKWTVTEVSGGGGSGAVYGSNGNVYGGSHTNPVQSTTTDHAELFVRDKEGKERVLKLKDEQITVRTGNWVSLLLAIPEGKERGDYVAVVNHDSGSLEFIRSGVINACSSLLTMAICAVCWVLAFLGARACYFTVVGEWGWLAGSPFIGFLLMLTLPAYFIWRWRLRRKFMAQVSALRSQIDDTRPAPSASAA